MQVDLGEALNTGIREAPMRANSAIEACGGDIQTVGQFAVVDASRDESRVFGIAGPQTLE